MSSVAARSLTTDLDGLAGAVGRTIGPTEWTEIGQEQVNAFADVTGDHNFLHVDPERARATPFRGTIAHGFLGLAFLAPVTQLLSVSDAATAVNYGLDKVRFPAPIPVGSRWRGSAEILEVTDVGGGRQVKMNATIEVEGSDRPSVAAVCLVRFYR